MIPPFTTTGYLPEGIHQATWKEFSERFGSNWYRKNLLDGMKRALENLKTAGCKVVYVDGSFVTSKHRPKDFDACWDPTGVDGNKVDPVLRTFNDGRKSQKMKYGGELFLSTMRNGPYGEPYLDFFQNEKENGGKKGIVAIHLEEFP